jgi:hypothetical protein
METVKNAANAVGDKIHVCIRFIFIYNQRLNGIYVSLYLGSN